jgi:uncharacterized membrane protein
MPLFLKLFATALPLLVVCDLLWLGVFMKSFYQSRLGHLMGDGVVWGAAVAFYIIFTLGLVYFVLIPAVVYGDIVRALLLGMTFGFVAYATYDLTNHATLRNWPLIVTVIDMLWGALLVGGISVLTLLIAQHLDF